MIELFHRWRLFVASYFAAFALVLVVAAVLFAQDSVYLYGAVRPDRRPNVESRPVQWPKAVGGVVRYLAAGGSLDPRRVGGVDYRRDFAQLGWAAALGLFGIVAPVVMSGRARAVAIGGAAAALATLVLRNFWIPMLGYEGPEGLASILDLACMVVVAWVGYCVYVAHAEFKRSAKDAGHG